MDLFDTSQFLTRNQCGAWTAILKWEYIIANLVITISYFIIPFILLNVWRQRKNIKSSYLLILFSLFIFSCGVTHLTEIAVFYWAAYRFYVLIYFITGIISLITAVVLPHEVKKKLRLLSREEYHKIVNTLQDEISKKEVAIMEKDKIIINLEIQIRAFERIKKRGNWLQEQEKILNELKNLLNMKV